MIEKDILELIQSAQMLLHPNASFDLSVNLYFDETNNLRKLFLRRDGFNAAIEKPFVLGGVWAKDGRNFSDLKKALNIQAGCKDIKYRHIAHGNFDQQLSSRRLKNFFGYLKNSNAGIHFCLIDYFYFTLVDIIEPPLKSLGLSQYSLAADRAHKSEFYRVLNAYRKEAIYFLSQSLFISEGIGSDNALAFYKFFAELHTKYESDFGPLNPVQAINRDALHNPGDGIIDEPPIYPKRTILDHYDFIYRSRAENFKDSKLTFDEEKAIQERVEAGFDGDLVFVPSEDCIAVQMSDILVGFVSNLYQHFLSNDLTSIEDRVDQLCCSQRETLRDFSEIYERSLAVNDVFVFRIMSNDQMAKIDSLDEILKAYNE